MTTETIERQAIETFDIRKEIEIAAPLEITFEAVLDELGPEGQMPDGKSLHMKIEPWPGGHWFRDLGNNSGHLWGHVQVIKPPTLLEICGPMPMSYPAVNHIQYRLKPEKMCTVPSTQWPATSDPFVRMQRLPMTESCATWAPAIRKLWLPITVFIAAVTNLAAHEVDPLDRCPAHSFLVPDQNVTVPVGVRPDDVTVADSFTAAWTYRSERCPRP